jgi:hypothetical protein
VDLYVVSAKFPAANLHLATTDERENVAVLMTGRSFSQKFGTLDNVCVRNEKKGVRNANSEHLPYEAAFWMPFNASGRNIGF